MRIGDMAWACAPWSPPH